MLTPVLRSLLDQQAASVELWIPRSYRRFPDWDGDLPAVPDGISIRRTEDDLGPATKYLPALACVPDTLILACDDDAIYGRGWAEGFLRASQEHPGAAIAASTFPPARIGLSQAPADALIVQGFAGVLLKREFLKLHEIGDRDRYFDDVWLSASLAAAQTPIESIPALRRQVRPLEAQQGLQDLVFDGLARGPGYHQSARALARELKIWGM